MSLSEEIRKLRQAAKPKLTQQGLADKAGVHVNTVINLEKDHYGDLSLSTLEGIAGALGTTADALLRSRRRPKTGRGRDRMPKVA